MGHEIVLFGCIEGVEFPAHQAHNLAEIEMLPVEGEWPWLTRGTFALPTPWPQGTYRSAIIHFGASLKDEPRDRTCIDAWILKFERLLRRLYWWSATLHLQTEFEPDRVFRWTPTAAAIQKMTFSAPQCTDEWTRQVDELPDTSH